MVSEGDPDIEVQLISMPGRKEMLRKVEDMIMDGDMPDVLPSAVWDRIQPMILL